MDASISGLIVPVNRRLHTDGSAYWTGEKISAAGRQDTTVAMRTDEVRSPKNLQVDRLGAHRTQHACATRTPPPAPGHPIKRQAAVEIRIPRAWR